MYTHKYVRITYKWLCVGTVAFHRLAILVHQKFSEVPFDEAEKKKFNDANNGKSLEYCLKFTKCYTNKSVIKPEKNNNGKSLECCLKFIKCYTNESVIKPEKKEEKIWEIWGIVF